MLIFDGFRDLQAAYKFAEYVFTEIGGVHVDVFGNQDDLRLDGLTGFTPPTVLISGKNLAVSRFIINRVAKTYGGELALAE
jgi:hypothetical protein